MLTGNLVNEELPSNISQDLRVAEVSPPHNILLHIEARDLTTGRSPTGQEFPVTGLKTSADFIPDDPLYPPAIRKPKNRRFITDCS